MKSLFSSKSKCYTYNSYKWSDLRFFNDVTLSKMFFPVEVLDTCSIDTSCQDSAKRAFRYYSKYISAEKDRVISAYSLADEHTDKGFFSIDFDEDFRQWVLQHVKESDLKQATHEFTKVNLLYFTSDNMVKVLLERACPLLYLQITKYELLDELKSLSRGA